MSAKRKAKGREPRAESPEPSAKGPLEQLGDLEDLELTPNAAELLDADPSLVDHLVVLRDPTSRPIARFKARGRLMEVGVIPEPPVIPRKEHPAISQGNPRALRIVGSTKCETGKPRPIWQMASKIEPRQQDWLWQGRLPRGTVSLIAGQKGDGKSTFLTEMVSIVTTGRGWPDGAPAAAPAAVVVLQDEESNASTLRPRLDRFGADINRVAFLTGVARGNSPDELSFSLARDIDALDVLCDEMEGLGSKVGMVLIDPIGSYMTGISGYCEGETREAISPLFRFAERRNVAVVAVAHLNKAGDKGIDDRISGTFALPAKARMVWYLSRDPSNRNRRLLTHLKGNLDDQKLTGLAFSYPNLRIVWSPKPVKLDAKQVDNLLRRNALDERIGVRPAGLERKSKVPAAKELVVTILEAGPIARADLLKKAAACGVSESTYRKALAQLIEADKRVSEDGDPVALRLIPAAAGEVQAELPDLATPADPS